MLNSIRLLSYACAIFLLGGCTALDRALLPSSAKTEISLKNQRVAVVVDACHYWSKSFDAYFSKEDSLVDIERISRGIESVFDEKKIDYKVIRLPFFCTFTGGYHEKDLRDKKGGTVIGSMKDGPHPIAQKLGASEQRLRESFLSVGCQFWQYKEDRLGVRVVPWGNAANLYRCKKEGYMSYPSKLRDVIPELRQFDNILIVQNILVSATLARVLITLDDGPRPSYSSAAILDLEKEKYVWDDFRNLRGKCWVTGGLDDYPTVIKPIGGLVCE